MSWGGGKKLRTRRRRSRETREVEEEEGPPAGRSPSGLSDPRTASRGSERTTVRQEVRRQNRGGNDDTAAEFRPAAASTSWTKLQKMKRSERRSAAAARHQRDPRIRTRKPALLAGKALVLLFQEGFFSGASVCCHGDDYLLGVVQWVGGGPGLGRGNSRRRRRRWRWS